MAKRDGWDLARAMFYAKREINDATEKLTDAQARYNNAATEMADLMIASGVEEAENDGVIYRLVERGDRFTVEMREKPVSVWGLKRPDAEPAEATSEIPDEVAPVEVEVAPV
jgi:hypothetical protein